MFDEVNKLRTGFGRHVIPAVALWDGMESMAAEAVLFIFIKTRHCVSGCARVVPSGLCLLRRFATHTTFTPLPSSRTRSAISCTGSVIPLLAHFQQYTRQQTTTNDCCRLQTFNQRVDLDEWRFFASKSYKSKENGRITTRRIWPYLHTI